MDLTQQILAEVRKQKLFKKGDTIVLGVSGGADSVAMLHALNALRHKLGVKLHIAHLNHRLRFSADRDENFVKCLALNLALPYTILRRTKSKSGVSENTARRWRFDFFKKVVKKTKAAAVALAHTENDVAETVLMRLLRGSGLAGLRGIRSFNEIDGLKVVRPMLTIQRREIERYLKQQGHKFCQDETNQQPTFLRNKIRLKLLPQLEREYNHNLSNVLVDLAYIAQADYDYLHSAAERLLKKYAHIARGRITIDEKGLLRQHICLQRILLRLSYERLTTNLNQLSVKHIHEVEDLLLNRPVGSEVHWPHSITVLKKKGSLVLMVSK